MNSRMKLLLLLMIITWIQQSGRCNNIYSNYYIVCACTYFFVHNIGSAKCIETVELRFNGVQWNLSLNTTEPVAQCLKETEVVNESEQTILLYILYTCNV